MKITATFDSIEEFRANMVGFDTDEDVVVTQLDATATVETRTEGSPDLDVNGMAWDSEIHSEKRTKTQAGAWKARKGMADEAKAAVAAHKAAGGNVTPPADLPTEAAPAAATMSGIPGATAAAPVARMDDAPAPITKEQCETKIGGMFQRGALNPESFGALLLRCGMANENLSDPAAILSTNETMRAAVYAECCAIEPEVG